MLLVWLPLLMMISLLTKLLVLVSLLLLLLLLMLMLMLVLVLEALIFLEGSPRIALALILALLVPRGIGHACAYVACKRAVYMVRMCIRACV